MSLKSTPIQVEAFVPQPQKKDKTKLTKKRFRTWVTVGRAKILYLDRKIVLVRQFDSESIYGVRDGRGQSVAYHRKHPGAKRIPEHSFGWRIHPDALKALAPRKST